MEGKLDEVLTAVKALTERIGSLEAKFVSFESKFRKINEKIEEQDRKIAELEKETNNKADYAELDGLLARIDRLEKEAVERESYSKRMNLLVHGLEEKEGNVWENKRETQEIFNNFVKQGLKMDPNSIPLVDIHRLPQHPVVRHGLKVTRPIIIKLANAMDKQKVMKNLKNLKSYNESLNQRLENSHARKKKQVFVTEHLPQAYYQQKKKLMPKFRQAREAGEQTRWGIVNGCYCLFINGEKV